MNVTFKGQSQKFPVSFGGGGSFDVAFKEGGGGGGTPYHGEYEVTPSEEEQVLETAMKTLSQNVVVNPIPSNYGRISYNGSVITVY